MMMTPRPFKQTQPPAGDHGMVRWGMSDDADAAPPPNRGEPMTYEGENDWKICQLVPANEDEEKGARESIKSVLDAIEARMAFMIREGDDAAVGTSDEAAMGYYVVKWISEPYSLMADKDGMAGIISAGALVADALFFNQVERAPYWYTQSEETTVVEVRHVLRSGLHLEEISTINPVPRACNRLEARRQKAVRVPLFDHEIIMEEAGKRDRLEYDEEEEEVEEEEGSSDGMNESGSEGESNGTSDEDESDEEE